MESKTKANRAPGGIAAADAGEQGILGVFAHLIDGCGEDEINALCDRLERFLAARRGVPG